jgi:hypothetical protein
MNPRGIEKPLIATHPLLLDVMGGRDSEVDTLN